jgi:hypothetical protein
MEYLWISVFVIWAAGWLREIAFSDAGLKKTGTPMPENTTFGFIILVLLFSWPYFYWYRKAMEL